MTLRNLKSSRTDRLEVCLTVHAYLRNIGVTHKAALSNFILMNDETSSGHMAFLIFFE